MNSSGDITQAPAPLRSDLERLVAVTPPLAGQVVKGMLLTIITLGIYRFWYRTNLRRYYWNNTRLQGDGFEYTGTGRELFIGFLIALAIIVPLQLAISLATLFGGEIVGPIVAFVLGAVVLPVLIQIAMWRARRYRLTRTRFRGIRFTQTGTGTAYMLTSVKWILLTLITLGIAFPYARRGLERFRIEHTRFGNAQARFNAEIGPLMKIWMLIWCVLPAFAILTAFGGNFGGFLGSTLFLALPFLWVWYRVSEFRTFTGGTRIGAISLSSDQSTASTIWIWTKYYLAVGGAFLVVGILASSLVMGVAQSLDFSDPEKLASLSVPPAAGLAILGMLVLGAIILSIVGELLLTRPLWALRASSVAVGGLSALDDIIAESGKDASGIGEAFDTDFDIAG